MSAAATPPSRPLGYGAPELKNTRLHVPEPQSEPPSTTSGSASRGVASVPIDGPPASTPLSTCAASGEPASQPPVPIAEPPPPVASIEPPPPEEAPPRSAPPLEPPVPPTPTPTPALTAKPAPPV